MEGCDNLRYLCSLSVASGLKKLKGLFVSECPLMEKIFVTEGNSADKKVCGPRRLHFVNCVLFVSIKVGE